MVKALAPVLQWVFEKTHISATLRFKTRLFAVWSRTDRSLQAVNTDFW